MLIKNYSTENDHFSINRSVTINKIPTRNIIHQDTKIR